MEERRERGVTEPRSKGLRCFPSVVDEFFDLRVPSLGSECKEREGIDSKNVQRTEKRVVTESLWSVGT